MSENEKKESPDLSLDAWLEACADKAEKEWERKKVQIEQINWQSMWLVRLCKKIEEVRNNSSHTGAAALHPAKLKLDKDGGVFAEIKGMQFFPKLDGKVEFMPRNGFTFPLTVLTTEEACEKIVELVVSAYSDLERRAAMTRLIASAEI